MINRRQSIIGNEYHATKSRNVVIGRWLVSDVIQLPEVSDGTLVYNSLAPELDIYSSAHHLRKM